MMAITVDASKPIDWEGWERQRRARLQALVDACLDETRELHGLDERADAFVVCVARKYDENLMSELLLKGGDDG